MDKKKITKIVVISSVVLLLLLLSRPFYMVDAKEQAVITRFGKYVRSEEPGLHLKLPFGIETAYKVPIQKVLREEFGFRTINADVKSNFYRGQKELSDAQMLTADLKIIQIEWYVQYRINDAYDYLFKVRYPNETLRAFSKVAMSEIIGDYLFDEIITIAKTEITFKMSELLQKMLDKINIGIKITSIELINVTPPLEVQDAYNEVLQAQQERGKIINQAKKQYNTEVIPLKGESEKLIKEAEGYKNAKITIAKGDVSYFNNLYREYIVAKDITKKRIYYETMSKVLPKLKDIYVVDEDQKNLVPLMQMGFKTPSKGGSND